jgi:prepilin-type N-terminal cleavage/methylation domain-containing protein
MAPEDDAMTGRTTRRGFTLIELLVVLTILAVLASLVLAAVLRTRTAQQNRTTESHLKKMEAVFARQRTAVFDTALADARNNAIPPIVTALAANDPERAKTLWHYIKYRRAFPVTFAEATSPIIITFTDPVTGASMTPLVLAAPQIFRTLPGGTTPQQQNLEAAACAYLFLTSRAERGEVMDMTEAAGSLVTDVDVKFNNQPYKVKVFKDTFGNMITFNRMLRATTMPELNAAPYATVKTGVANFLDPLDPLGRLTKTNMWNPAWTPAQNAALITQAAAACGLTGFVNENWTGTFASPGQDGVFGNADDIFGYRVRQGN